MRDYIEVFVVRLFLQSAFLIRQSVRLSGDQHLQALAVQVGTTRALKWWLRYNGA